MKQMKNKLAYLFKVVWRRLTVNCLLEDVASARTHVIVASIIVGVCFYHMTRGCLLLSYYDRRCLLLSYD